MSTLISGYSSSEGEDVPTSPSDDAFGLSSMVPSKRPRLDNSSSTARVESSAPDVLAEVS